MAENEKKPRLTKAEEARIVAIYNSLSEEDLLDIIRKKTKALGRFPKRDEIPCSYFFRNKYGPWPRVLEAAGVKPVSQAKLRREAAMRQKHLAQRIREKEYRAKRRAEREAAAAKAAAEAAAAEQAETADCAEAVKSAENVRKEPQG